MYEYVNIEVNLKWKEAMYQTTVLLSRNSSVYNTTELAC